MAEAPAPTRALPAGAGHLDFGSAGDGGQSAGCLLLPVAPRFAGIDLLDVPRLGRAVTRTGPALERRICTPAELSVLPEQPGPRLAELSRIFSVKESAVKALGGMPRGATFRDLCTGASRSRRTAVATRGEAARRADHLGVSLFAGSREMDARAVLSWAIAVAS